MPEREPLPHDPESLEKWQQMPSTPPSKQALPPATGGMRGLSVKLLIALLVFIILVGLLQQGRPL
jgi:hypothetical protein